MTILFVEREISKMKRRNLIQWEHPSILDIPLFLTFLYSRLSSILDYPLSQMSLHPLSHASFYLDSVVPQMHLLSHEMLKDDMNDDDRITVKGGNRWGILYIDTTFIHLKGQERTIQKRIIKGYTNPSKGWERTYFISILHVLVKVAGANQNDVPSLYKIIRVLYFSIPPLNWSSALKVKWKKDGIWGNSALEKGSYIK